MQLKDLRLAKRQDCKQKKYDHIQTLMYKMNPIERIKERKNGGGQGKKVENRAQVMNLIKAQREEKKERRKSEPPL